MVVGDVLNVGQAMLVCISGEGSLLIFDVTAEPDAWTATDTVVLSGPTARHPVPVNVCRAIVADIGTLVPPPGHASSIRASSSWAVVRVCTRVCLWLCLSSSIS
jgi:hypothetical protein